MKRNGLSLLLLVAVMSPIVRADDDGITFFEKKIRPMLVQECYRCHSEAKKIRGGLALDSKEGLLTGGDTGPAIVPGDVKKSLLLKALHYTDPDLQMPPKGKLPAQVIADFERWVKMGAPDPRTKKNVAKKYGVDIEEGRKFWAFQPVKDLPTPTVKDKTWAKNDIDRFVMHYWDNKGIRPVADADRETLIRRAYFDLIGLPPTPKQIDAFVNDKSANAFAKVVDELLASPHYGERWGRHWLDVARYAESSGGGRSLLFPDAWRYRDYVIQSFNSDKPYNRFVKEQLAGDLLDTKAAEERYWNIIATGFLMLGPTNYELQDKPVLEMDVIDEQLDTIGRTMMGMTIGCARCHDHKFDPIPTSDYYAMAGIFKSTRSLVHSNVSKWVETKLPMLDPKKEETIREHEQTVVKLQKQINGIRSKLKDTGMLAAKGILPLKGLPGIVIDDTQAKKVGTWNKSTFMDTYVHEGYLYAGGGNNTLTFVPKIVKDGNYEVRLAYLPYNNRTTKASVRIFHTDGEDVVFVNQKEIPPIDGRWTSLGKYRFEKGEQWFVMISTKGARGTVVADAVQFIHEDDLEEKQEPKEPAIVDKSDLKKQLKTLEARLKKTKAAIPRRPVAMCVTEADKTGDYYICVRGNVHNKADKVKRGFLQVATTGKMPTIPDNESGRRQLAEWLSSDDHPLTARVMVNRIWHHLFGSGIVRTTDNFGSTGSLPNNPELLDHLTTRFQKEGWSIKKLIREIMLSRTYQLSSRVDGNNPTVRTNLKADVENKLFWHQNRRRLEAEVIRDAMLLVSGQLDRKMGGPGMPNGNIVERTFKFTDTRRSVYTPVFRNNLLEMFEVFDFPDPNMVKGTRAASTVSSQALFLMNSPFVMAQADQAAKQRLTEGEMSDSDRVNTAYRNTLGRLPTDGESKLALAYLGQAKTDEQRQQAWGQFYQVLFASIDFRYVN